MNLHQNGYNCSLVDKVKPTPKNGNLHREERSKLTGVLKFSPRALLGILVFLAVCGGIVASFFVYGVESGVLLLTICGFAAGWVYKKKSMYNN